MSRPFKVLLRVRYGECDAQGVMFNARYADYVDIAFTEFQRHSLGGYPQMLENGLDTQVVKLTLEWQSSARFDEVLAIDVEPVRIGNSSYTLKLNMRERDSGREVAIAEVVYVMVDATDYTKRSIPDHIRKQLETGATGLLVDQSSAAAIPH